jgi:uncharacterized protein YndB with AHSA1/START domain
MRQPFERPSRSRSIVRSVVIDCHIEDVFAYVADPRNDAAWRVPTRSRRARHGTRTRVDSEPPRRIAWREGDGHEVIDVTYELESVWTSTRVTERDDVRLGVLRRIAMGRNVARRLSTLKRVLERRA